MYGEKCRTPDPTSLPCKQVALAPPVPAPTQVKAIYLGSNKLQDFGAKFAEISNLMMYKQIRAVQPFKIGYRPTKPDKPLLYLQS